MTNLRRHTLLVFAVLAMHSVAVAQTAHLAMTPPVLNFGSVINGKCTSRTVVVRNTSRSIVMVRTIDIDGDTIGFSAATQPAVPHVLAPDDTMVVVVRYCAHSAAQHSGRLHVVYTLDSVFNVELHDTSLVLTAVGQSGVPEISYSRSDFRFPLTPFGAVSDTLSDTATSVGTSDVQILGIVPRNGFDHFRVYVEFDTGGTGWSRRYMHPNESSAVFPLTLRPGDRFRTSVVFVPSQSLSSPCAGDSLLLLTSVGTRSFSLAGCVPAGYLRSMPPSVDFGTVQLGRCAERQLQLFNAGTVSLELTESMILGGEGAFRILDNNGRTQSSFRASIAPGQTVAVRIQFCPSIIGTYNAIDTFVHDGMNRVFTVPLQGRGARYWSDPTEIGFGDVAVGEWRDTVIVLMNVSQNTISTTSVRISPTGASNWFNLTGEIPQVPAFIAPGGSLQLHLRFQPIDVRYVQASLDINADSSDMWTIMLSGRGIERKVTEENAVAIASTQGRVGEPVELRVVLAEAEPPNSDRIAHVRLRVDPDSFFPVAIDGWTVVSRQRGDITYARKASAPITGKLLGAFRLRPLSTAQPVDTVWLVSVSFDSVQVPITDEVALVQLEGCDIGRPQGLTRALRVQAVTSISASDEIDLEFTAPAGLVPIARILDLSGEVVTVVMLPRTTDGPQRARLDLSGVPPGMLFVELRLGDQRAITPIMHRR